MTKPDCDPATHRPIPPGRHLDSAFARAVGIFKALGDEPRLRLLELLLRGEACVSELAAASAEPVSTVSHRLRLLRNEGLVAGRRDGKHVYYSVADGHVAGLVLNALDHGAEDGAGRGDESPAAEPREAGRHDPLVTPPRPTPESN